MKFRAPSYVMGPTVWNKLISCKISHLSSHFYKLLAFVGSYTYLLDHSTDPPQEQPRRQKRPFTTACHAGCWVLV